MDRSGAKVPPTTSSTGEGFLKGCIDTSTNAYSQRLTNLGLSVSPIIPGFSTPQNLNVPSQRASSNANNLNIEGDGVLKEILQTDTTPSQRRSNNVSLSARFDKRLLESYNRDKGRHMSPSMLYSDGVLKESVQTDTTPSQRRSNNVSLSGLTHQRPYSRILQGSSTMQTTQIPTKMPALRISPNKTHQPTVHSRIDKRLLESYNCDKGRHMSPSMLYIKESHIKSKCMESGSSKHRPLRNAAAMTLPEEIDIPVFVPELSELNVRCSDWMSSHSDLNWHTTPPEVRNLMDSFNTAEHMLEASRKTCKRL